jgi:glycogen(starch) synthase
MRAPDRVRRVLMTADTMGGVWTYAMDMARGLARYDVEIALATMGRSLSPHQVKEAAELSNVSLYDSTYKLEWMPDPWQDVERAGQWLLALERDFRPDVIHLNGYAHGSLPWRAPQVVTGHSCVLSWWQAVKREPAPGRQWAGYRAAVSRGLRAARLVIAPTRAMLAELQRHYGPLDSAVVISNGRSSQLYRPARKEPVILSAGRLWDEAKNIGALRAACRTIEWPVAVAGDTTHPEGFTRDFGNLRMLGILSCAELADWYSRAAVYCAPARYEPFGLSVLEAALSGCALVLGDIPSLRENWDGAAVFVPPDDTAELESQLRTVILDAGHRARLAQRALLRAQSFSLERSAESYLAAYSTVMAKRPTLAVTGN